MYGFLELVVKLFREGEHVIHEADQVADIGGLPTLGEQESKELQLPGVAGVRRVLRLSRNQVGKGGERERIVFGFEPFLLVIVVRQLGDRESDRGPASEPAVGERVGSPLGVVVAQNGQADHLVTELVVEAVYRQTPAV